MADNVDNKKNSSPFGRLFNTGLNLALIALVIWYAYRYHGLLYPSSQVKSTEQAQVIMYSTKWCPFCIEARGFLSKNGVPYYDYNINESTDGLTQFRRLGGKGVPLFIIKGKVIHGLQRAKLTKLLEIK